MGQALGSGAWNGGGGKDVGENTVGVKAFQLSFRLESDAVAEDGEDGALDVVGNEVGAVFQRGDSLGDAHEAEGSAGAGAEGECGPLAGAADEVEDVVEQLGLDADGADLSPGGEEQVESEGLEVGSVEEWGAGGGMGGEMEFEDLALFGGGGVVDPGFEEEAVELCLREGVGAFEVDGVLGGEDGEVRGEGADGGVGGDLALFHTFEEGGLGAGRHAIDFVDKEEIGEDRAGVEGELTGALDEDGGAEDVSRHEIRGGLDALEAEAEDSAEGLDQEGFGDAGDAFEEDMALAENRDEGFIDDTGLAGDDLAELGANLVDEFRGGGESRGGGIEGFVGHARFLRENEC